MEKIEKGHSLSQSTDIVSENIETLKTLFPTIVKDGKIDIEELQALLGNEVETGEEYYRFTWAGKSLARREANKPSTATLRPDKESSKDWDTTKNIFIEGDNLEVLKLLQKSYANKIKMIYIDPPYNTGNEGWVYNDNVNSPEIKEWLVRVVGDEATDLSRHDKWLCMMYPRLRLLRDFLREDGVIMISIDDFEVFHLRVLLNEIFGPQNFIAQLVWDKTRKNDAKLFSVGHE